MSTEEEEEEENIQNFSKYGHVGRKVGFSPMHVRGKVETLPMCVGRKVEIFADEEIKKKLIVSDPLVPRIYGLPKIHKPGVPLRPIVDTIGSPTYRLAKFLVEKLKPLVGNTSSFIKDSSYFIEKIKHRHMEEEDILLSLDIVSLFTMIHIKEAISVIEDLTDPETSLLV